MLQVLQFCDSAKRDLQSLDFTLSGKVFREIQGGPKKVSHCQIIKNLCKFVLKSANEIRFFVKLNKW